jgi:hypothetical protein
MNRNHQARTGRGIHGLPKVSCGPALPDPYTPCGRLGGGRLLPPWIPLPARACCLTVALTSNSVKDDFFPQHKQTAYILGDFPSLENHELSLQKRGEEKKVNRRGYSKEANKTIRNGTKCPMVKMCY